MSIKNVKIENFTVFEKIDIDFASDVNVIIGENGTGKTHLMKCVYGIIKEINQGKEITNYFGLNSNPHNVLVNLQSELTKYFSATATELIRNNVDNQSSKLSVICDEMKFRIDIEYNSEKKIYEAIFRTHTKGLATTSCFISAKDMLTHSKGFLSMYDKFDMPFDKTYYDIISKSLLLNLKEVPQIGLSILPKLENIIGGKVIVENDTFFIEKADGRKVEFSVEAEGIKKIAILWQLIMNESITKGSVLFWDEPEANINPKLIKDVVEILLELSRNGVQIFVATHNYVFAKYVEVLMKDTDDVSFHALYKTENEVVKCETNKNFRDLQHNSIISTFDKLLDEVFDLNIGD